MEDFLSEITDQIIQNRVKKLKEFIQQQRKQILKKIQGHRQQIRMMIKSKSDKIINSPKKNLNDKELVKQEKQQNQEKASPNLVIFQEAQKCYLIFQKACENILSIYFPLLMEDQFLSLQSDEQINQKLSCLESVIEKTAVNLIKKLTRPESEKKQQQVLDQEQIQQFQSSSQKVKKIKKDKGFSNARKRKGKNTKISNQHSYVMQKWLLQNFHDPYPTQLKKQQMAQQSGLTVPQVNNWFINARQRVIKKFLKKDSSNISSLKMFEEQQAVQKPSKKIKRSVSSNSIKLSKEQQNQDFIMESK